MCITEPNNLTTTRLFNIRVSKLENQDCSIAYDEIKKFKERWYDLVVKSSSESKKKKEFIEEFIDKEATVNIENVLERISHTEELPRIEVRKFCDLEKWDSSRKNKIRGTQASPSKSMRSRDVGSRERSEGDGRRKID